MSDRSPSNLSPDRDKSNTVAHTPGKTSAQRVADYIRWGERLALADLCFGAACIGFGGGYAIWSAQSFEGGALGAAIVLIGALFLTLRGATLRIIRDTRTIDALLARAAIHRAGEQQ